MAASIAGFISTLLATLIGVGLGFRLDKVLENRARKKTVQQHLEAVVEELESNKNIIKQNRNVIKHLQDEGNNATHYALRKFSSNAWEAALDNQFIEHLDDDDLYQNLQSLYANIDSTNELIKRLRTESLHPRMGETENEYLDTEVWTVNVAYWDRSREEVEETGLADLIKSESDNLNIEIDGVKTELEDIITRLDESNHHQRAVLQP